MHRKERLQYSLDVLTDGSEYTGHGTVFLTVTRKSAYSPISQPEDEVQLQGGTILARYALTGLSTLTARLATDQSYKLSYVKSIFLPNRTDVISTAGISSLLLSLSNYSMTGALHCVGPVGTSDFIEELSKLILGTRREYPKVTVCEVPTLTQETSSCCWWKVYEDEYILVHARTLLPSSLQTSDKSLDAIVYIVTFCCGVDDTEERDKFSFVICPPYLDMAKFTSKILEPLPDSIRSNRNVSKSQGLRNEKIEASTRKRVPFQFFLLCDPYVRLMDPVSHGSMVRIPIHTSLLTLANDFLTTIPNNYNDCREGQWDHGLLIRAAHQALKLHASIPSAFPLRLVYTEPNPISSMACLSQDGKSASADPIASAIDDGYWDHLCYKLCSCTSILMKTTDIRPPSINQDESIFRFIDRRKCLWNKVKVENTESVASDASINLRVPFSWHKRPHDPNDIDLEDSWHQRPEDPNEIDLEDQIDQDEGHFSCSSPSEKRLKWTEGSQPKKDGKGFDPVEGHNAVNETGGLSHIIVLGTGCAAPAPLRGSSGYALFIPSTVCGSFSVSSLALTCMIECGEGCLTSLSRFIPQQPTKTFQDHLLSLEWVWISHAHFDHYGELPVFIHYLNSKRGESCQCFQGTGRCLSINPTHLSKDGHRLCSKCNRVLPLLVIAPTKVLRYADISLCTVDGILYNCFTKSYTRLFLGLSHQEFDLSPHVQHLYLGVHAFDKRRLKIRNIPVQHCTHSYALLMGFQSPSVQFTLCYSGDTRPCQRLAQACRDESIIIGEKVTLLIHEATFDDDQPMDALKKSHCTVSEALGIFKASGAGSCVLSHFSQRYPRLPPTNSATPSFALGSYGMAADGMLIPLDARMLANLGQFNRSQYPEQVVNNSIDPPSIHEVG